MAAVVFVGSFGLRFLDADFANDHFNPLSKARQVVHGEVPFRDFVDPGWFLQIYMSAAAQLVFGYSLLAEALVCVFFLSIGATLTFLLASRASGSLLVGLGTAALVVATFPRLYNYPKVFLYVLAIFLAWRYIDAPRPWNLVWLGLLTTAAFLFRHDHGVFIGVGSAVTVVAAHWSEARRRIVPRLILYGAAAAIPLVPFFVFLELNGGLVDYLRTAIGYTRGVRDQQAIDWPAFAVDTSEPLVSVRPAPPPPSGPINVRWAEGVGQAERIKLEARYRLDDGEPQGGQSDSRTWRYRVLDGSEQNLAGLVRDRRVQDTDGVDRDGFYLQEPLLTAWQRVIPVLRVSLAPGVIRSENAVPWLYYVFVGLPAASLIALGWRSRRGDSTTELMPREAPKIVSAAVLCAVAAPLLLRSPLEARLPDLAAPLAVLGAWLFGICLARRGGGALPSLRAAGALSLAGVTSLAIIGMSDLARGLEADDLALHPRALFRQAREIADELSTSPPIDAWAPPGTDGREVLARYVHECTKPTDKTLVIPVEREFYFYADRPFAGGNFIFVAPRFTSTEEQEQFLDRFADDSVPIVIVEIDRYGDFEASYPLIDAHLDRTYRPARDLDLAEDEYRILVDRRLTPSGTFRPWSLPCFK